MKICYSRFSSSNSCAGMHWICLNRFLIRGLAIAALLLSASACAKWQPNPEGIDPVYALSVVEELSKPEYQGRQAGSAGGQAARSWLVSELDGFGLTTELQAFIERSSVLTGEARLELSGLFDQSRAYRFRQDFRDITRGGYEGGSAEGPLFLVSDPALPFPAGAVLLLPFKLYNLDDLTRWTAASALLVELAGGSPLVRPLYAGQGPGRLVQPKEGPVLLAFDETLFAEAAAAWQALPTAAAPTARVASPLRFRDFQAANVFAAWNGDGGSFKPEYLFMAHYDHVGLDLDGTPFPGALDNASGVALLLALAQACARDAAPYDVAFLFTDAEESGLTGAQAFVHSPRLTTEGLQVINLDMVAAAADLELGVLYSGDDTSRPLAEALAAALGAAGFRAAAVQPYPNLDHAPFTYMGLAAVSINEYDTADYHRTSDFPETV
ncbi:MAG: Zn-dependent exopeptidase M28, partial [Spirochaetes bacterium]|nr:Zn-dependent exopeptidase M28 [Spirochaetota bacterium]